MHETLVKKKLISRVTYLDSMKQLVTARGALRRNRSETARVRQAIAEAREKLVQLDSELRSDALAEMGEVSAELAQLRRLAGKAKDRVARLEIRSPVRGVVKNLVPNTIGGVIAPGSEVAEIVPLDEELIAEVRIGPPDVGSVTRGQPVSVNVSAYDFYRYGGIDGTLDRVSASTFQDDDGSLYYKGMITLEASHVGQGERANPILPGMTIEANINTGERTLLEYLIKPIYRSVSNAFDKR